MMPAPAMRTVLLATCCVVGAAATPHGPFDQAADRAKYLGQTPPGLVPERFAPGIVSTPAMEINGVFAPNFREFFFARHIDGVFTLHRSRRDGDRWSAPEPLRVYPGGAAGLAVDMAYSPDGRELFFLGRFKPGVPPLEGPSDIWRIRRNGAGWSLAETVPAPISTDANESYPTVTSDGSLYFVSNRPGGVGNSDIWRAARLPDGTFAEPVNLGKPANSEAGEGDPFVSPDERYLIITARRPDGFGEGDLYVSFRTAAGTWSQPVSLGESINTPVTEFCPMVTPDGRYLFFSRRYGGATWENATDADVFWVDIAVVERLRRR